MMKLDVDKIPSKIVFQFAVENIKNCNFAYFYVCWTWYVAWKEDHKPQVLGNRVLGKMFDPKRGKFQRKEKVARWGPSWFVLVAKYLCNQIKEDEIGRECGTNCEDKFIHSFGGDAWRIETTLEN